MTNPTQPPAAAEPYLVEIHPCVVEGEPDAKTVWLRVGVQQFCVTPLACENTEEAEWMAARLGEAIERIVVARLAAHAQQQAEEIEELKSRLSYMDEMANESDRVHRQQAERIAELERALAELISKLDAVKPHLDSIETLAYVHGVRYEGPEYGTALAAARLALGSKEGER